MTSKDGGPAFPGTWWEYHPIGETVARESYPGMSLRDWFAGMALQGWLASYGAESQHPAELDEPCLKILAADAYETADAMLRARESTLEAYQ